MASSHRASPAGLPALAEYVWHADPDQDPFHQHLNQGNLQQILAALGRA